MKRNSVMPISGTTGPGGRLLRAGKHAVSEKRHKLFGLAAACLCLALACPAAFGSTPASLKVSWSIPTYVDPGKPLEGAATVKAPAGTTLQCWYQPEGGKAAKVACAPSDNQTDQVEFKIPSLNDTPPKSLTLWLEAHNDTKSFTSDKKTLPVAHVQDFDITGDAAIELTYPIDRIDAKVVFIPCCTIYGGLVRAATMDVNPRHTDKGLLKTIQRPFLVLKPGHLAATTSGLQCEFGYGDPPQPGMQPEVFKYNSKTQAWEAISDPKVSLVRQRLRVACPSGGALVLGWVK